MPPDSSYELLRRLHMTQEDDPPPLEDDCDPVEIPAEFSDECLALRFTAQHGRHLRYVAGWGKWMQWTGETWKADQTLGVFDLARRVCRQASSEASQNRVASAVASAKTVASVERLAKADRQHAATVEQWDSDPWLLNTPDGVVDLRTGRMRVHNPTDYMTKTTAVGPRRSGCDRWLTFLDTAMQGDTELIGFLRRVAGYSLTGSTREHALFFGYGTGANGKSVLVDTLTGILGEYATVAGIETFTASPNDRHPTDLAMLRGARLVTAQETEEGRRWAESRIKSMTGGDPITARFMRQDFFTYQPTFKLLIAGNHKPGLRNVDEAIRRRFNLIPFSVRIPPEQRDKELAEKLKEEWPAILAWAIEGCLEWQAEGLRPPAAVVDATADYLEAEDAVAGWLAERCIVDRNLEYAAGALFQDWRTWAEAAGEAPGSQRRFSQALQSRGFEPLRSKTARNFRGLGLRPNTHQTAAWDR